MTARAVPDNCLVKVIPSKIKSQDSPPQLIIYIISSDVTRVEADTDRQSVDQEPAGQPGPAPGEDHRERINCILHPENREHSSLDVCLIKTKIN